MKIVFDLQALQTEASRNRGIGRYTRALMRAIIAEGAGRHDIHFLICKQLPMVDNLLEEFAPLVGIRNLHLFLVPEPLCEFSLDESWRIHAAEKIKAALLSELKPDLFHINSLFEGYSENYVGPDTSRIAPFLTTITLYDLIPYVNQEKYLAPPQSKRWYGRKITALINARLLLSISEFSRQEALDVLGLPAEQVVAISTNADEQFRKQKFSTVQETSLRQKLGLQKPFIMYTGGFDSRKNIEGLIKACAELPLALRGAYQLAIICKLQEEEKAYLNRLAQKAGMPAGMLVLPGFVTDDELVMLYNLCHLFVFPSFQEGFGLPVLEAMRCGAPVIGTNCTSLPEIIGDKEAMFDPYQAGAMNEKIVRALIDDGYRQKLIDNGAVQEKKFSWHNTARRALESFEHIHNLQKHNDAPAMHTARISTGVKPRMAFVSPVKPQQSGIADYGAHIVQALAAYYEIDLVTTEKFTTDFWQNANCKILSPEEFEKKAHRYDRILYQFGNSEFHQHMFGLLKRHPGIVVLHDFFMSGIRYFMQTRDLEPDCFTQSLYHSHGYRALSEAASQQVETTIYTYPCNIDILEQAAGVIIHSDFSAQLAQKWYGAEIAKDWARIPLLRKIPSKIDRQAARKRLNIPSDVFMACSFGFLAPTKCNLEIIAAWQASGFAKRENTRLVFVGNSPNPLYSKEVSTAFEALPYPERALITGYVDEKTYADYLMAADIAIQLRTNSRGETSAAIQDGFAYGLPMIINNHGSAIDIADDLAIKIPDIFTVENLSAALKQLGDDATLRKIFSEKTRQFAFETISPEKVADLYYAAIEQFAENHLLARRASLVRELTPLLADAPKLHPNDYADIAQSIAEIYPTRRRRFLFIDITEIMKAANAPAHSMKLLKNIIFSPGDIAIKIEAIFFDGTEYRYAREFTCKTLGIVNPGLIDEPVIPLPGDKLQFFSPRAANLAQDTWLRAAETKGLVIEEIKKIQSAA